MSEFFQEMNAGAKCFRPKANRGSPVSEDEDAALGAALLLPTTRRDVIWLEAIAREDTRQDGSE